MSSAGAPGAAAAPQRYYCHKCGHAVTVFSAPDGELSCSVCDGGFVEEFDEEFHAPNPNSSRSPNVSSNPNPNAPPFFAFSSSNVIPSPNPSALPSSATDPFFPAHASPQFAFHFPTFPAVSYDIRSPGDLAGLFGHDGSPPMAPAPAPAPAPASALASASASAPAGPEPFNPFAFLQNHLQDLMAGGATIQFVIEGGSGGPLPANFGDYFFGSGLEQLIQQLAENDPNRYGTPPASKSAVESLPDIKISQDLLTSDEEQCAVCKDAFEVGAEVKQMPCKHIYHKDCILPWLALHNSCPVCRYELPTDDPDYESHDRVTPAPAGQAAPGATGVGFVGGGGATDGVPGPRMGMVDRRFRISLPWPLSSLGHSGASNTGDSGNSGSGEWGGLDENSGGR